MLKSWCYSPNSMNYRFFRSCIHLCCFMWLLFSLRAICQCGSVMASNSCWVCGTHPLIRRRSSKAHSRLRWSYTFVFPTRDGLVGSSSDCRSFFVQPSDRICDSSTIIVKSFLLHWKEGENWDPLLTSIRFCCRRLPTVTQLEGTDRRWGVVNPLIPFVF